MLLKLSNLISELDLYAERVGFSIGGRGQSKSVLGAFITFITVGICFYLTSGTFMDYYNEVNPTLSYGFIYDTTQISINETNPFISIGFFVPIDGTKGLSNSTTDFNKANTISKVAVSCTNCTIPKEQIFLNDYCNDSIIDNIAIGGMSSRSSRNITDIFNTKSYCFPTFNATLVDDDKTVKNFISSLTLYIPDTYNPSGVDSTTSIEFFINI